MLPSNAGLARTCVISQSHPVATFHDILVPRPRSSSREFLNARGLQLTYNGRGALLLACKGIASHGKRDILMPAYHCPSGITPAIHAGLRPVFYRIKRDLSIDFDDLNAKVTSGTAAVLVIHYFGMAADIQPLHALGQRGIEIIEDWSHSFLRGLSPRLPGSLGDYCVYSFWKLIPCEVGGALWRRHESAAFSRPQAPAPGLRERAVRVKKMLEEALAYSNYPRVKKIVTTLETLRLAWRGSFVPVPELVTQAPVRGEDHYPFDPSLVNCRLPGLSRRILESSNFSQVVARRRENFLRYSQLLRSSDQMQVLYPQLPPETCPWVFPVLLNQRDDIDHVWRAAGVGLHTFGIALHSALFEKTDAATVADAQFLSTHVLCLAIHQDLTPLQIERSASIIHRNGAGTPAHRMNQGQV